MDLIGVREVRVAHTRDDLVFAPGELPLGGGTWLFSEEQPGLTGLVDLTTLGWEPLTIGSDGLSIAGTCTLAELSRLPAREEWAAHPLIWQCVNSLLGSFKVWNVATVAGNICMALPAGPMTSFAAAMDATALVWSPDGSERVIPVAALVEGAHDGHRLDRRLGCGLSAQVRARCSHTHSFAPASEPATSNVASYWSRHARCSSIRGCGSEYTWSNMSSAPGACSASVRVRVSAA